SIALVIGTAAKVWVGDMLTDHVKIWFGVFVTSCCLSHLRFFSQGSKPRNALKLTIGSRIRLVGMVQGSNLRPSGSGNCRAPRVRTYSPSPAIEMVTRGGVTAGFSSRNKLGNISARSSSASNQLVVPFSGTLSWVSRLWS